MITSYTTTAQTVNTPLTAQLLDLLDLLRDLAARHGYSWARNEWLAQRTGRTPRTITRQIAALIRDGYITAQRVGNERHISPTPTTPQKTRPKQVSHTLRNPDTPPEMSTRCLPASLECKTRENNTPQPPSATADDAIVADLQAEGVHATVAKRLAADKPDECRTQIAAAKSRTGIRDKAAYLVAGILNGWRHKKKQDTPTAQSKRYAARPTEQPQDAQNALEADYDALPEAQRQQIEQQIIKTLSPAARRGKYIIRAACISHFRARITAAAPAAATNAAAPAFAT